MQICICILSVILGLNLQEKYARMLSSTRTQETLLFPSFHGFLYSWIILKETCDYSIIKKFKFPLTYFIRFLNISTRIIWQIAHRGCRLDTYGLDLDYRSFFFFWPMVYLYKFICCQHWTIGKFHIKIPDIWPTRKIRRSHNARPQFTWESTGWSQAAAGVWAC